MKAFARQAFASRWQINFLRRKLMQRAAARLRTVDRMEAVPPEANVLLVTIQHELAETMVYPFHFYRARLRHAGIKLAELPLAAVTIGAAPRVISRNIKRIFFQPTLHMPTEEAVRAIQTLQSAFPGAKVAFMDWFAPLHLHPAVGVEPLIDVYIKKQVFKDFEEFRRPVMGDTNLSDYYSKGHHLGYPIMVPQVSESLKGKLRLWSNFGLSPQMVDLFLSPLPDLDHRSIDLHARLAVNGEPWYKAMRQEAKDAVDRLAGITIAQHGRVRRDQFFAELADSKLCFSPFGYGEICWRDYEAFATGALLLKPSIDHLDVDPTLFIPGETYVSLPWNLSSLQDVIKEYLNNDAERDRICRNAHQRYKEWIIGARAVDRITPLIG